VDLVEKLGHLLHFVYDDEAPTTLGGDLLPQELGVLQVAPVLFRPQEIDPLGVGVGLSQERRLATLARPPQEEALCGRVRQSDRPLEHAVHFIMHI